MNNTESLSINFIQSYLNLIRHNASQISQADRGIFPSYWFYPYQIIVQGNTIDDVAIILKRKISGKKGKTSVRTFNDRIEKSVLPYLDYRKSPMWNIPNDGHHIIMLGGTFSVLDHPLFTIGLGAEVKFMNSRIEASVQGYPIEFELVWILTFPNTKYFTRERAEKDAEMDFWERFSIF